MAGLGFKYNPGNIVESDRGLSHENAAMAISMSLAFGS